MKLSLMTINLTRSILLDERYQPRPDPDAGAYEDILRRAKAAGFQGVDLTGNELLVFGPERVAALLEAKGLRCASVIHFDNYTSLDPEETAAVAERTRRIIDGCALLGTKVLMLVAGWPTPGASREALFEGLCANLRPAVAYAGDRLRVCVEDFPSTELPMSAAADMGRLLEAVPGLGLVYDSANMLTEGEDPMGYFHRFARSIAYYHLKDVRLSDTADYGDRLRDGRRMITTVHGGGVIDFAALGGLLGFMEYEGFLSLEYAPDPAHPGEDWAVIAADKAYLEGVLGIADKAPLAPRAVPKGPDPGDANRITRAYLDSLLLEERLIDAVLPRLDCEFFGERFDSPIMPAAFSHLIAFGEGRETGMVEYARACRALNILNWVGMMEDGEFQSILDTGARTVRIVKPYADRERLLGQLRYAAAHGAAAVGLDIDHSFDGKGGCDLVFGEPMAPLSAAELAALVRATDLPFVVKGVLSVRDAKKCADCGVKGILVSHHHGRLPYAVPPLALLPEIAQALRGSGVQIIVDCHMDTGYDAYKALALGADGVCVGRAMLPALRKDGVQGAVGKLREMNGELLGAMSYTGVGSLRDMDPGALRRI